MVSSDDDFINGQVAKAYELLEGRQDVYVQIVTDKAPLAKRQLKEPASRFYNSSESP